MVEIIYFLIIIIASGLGSISGMGGGIIIKPLMDSFGYHSVSDIAFYSSFSVFIMAIISTTKRFSQSKEIKWRLIFTVSFSSVLGGFLGHLIFQVLLSQLSVRLVSIVQMILLFVMLLVSFVLTDFKKTYQFDKIGFYMICGLLLGLISSFLGIGGGPLNVSLLMVFFFYFDKRSNDVFSCNYFLFPVVSFGYNCCGYRFKSVSFSTCSSYFSCFYMRRGIGDGCIKSLT